MMIQPSTTMMKILAIQYLTTFITLRNHQETLKPSILPSKQRLVSSLTMTTTQVVEMSLDVIIILSLDLKLHN